MNDPIIKNVHDDIKTRNKVDQWISRFLKKYLGSKDKSVSISFDDFKTDFKVLIGGGNTNIANTSTGGSTYGIGMTWQLVAGVWTPTITLTTSAWNPITAISGGTYSSCLTMLTSTTPASYRYNPLGQAELNGTIEYEINWAQLTTTCGINPLATSFNDKWIDFDVIPDVVSTEYFTKTEIVVSGSNILRFKYVISSTDTEVYATVLSGSIPTTGTSKCMIDLSGIQFAAL